ncbi:transposase [Clostridiaceae bacterium M8S5]|nr:transposase [Clostridiaceae bacterium M8S5]
MVRGNNKARVLKNGLEKRKFLEIIKRIKKEIEFDLLAYCIMDNHVHLLINISIVMKKINTMYAMYYDFKYDRVGHVFQNRYKSEPVEDDSYLLNLMRYIHNNPVKAKMVEHVNEYKWSSYKEYIKESIDLVDTELIKSCFQSMRVFF